MKVKRVESSFLPWKNIIVVEATEYEDAVFETFFGDKVFWVEEDERYRLTVPKSWCVEPDDELDLAQLVMEHRDTFKWNWK